MTRSSEQGRFYRLPTKKDAETVCRATEELEKNKRAHKLPLSLLPDEEIPMMSGVFNVPIYGHTTWESLFTPRQGLALSTIARLVREVGIKLDIGNDTGLSRAIHTQVY